MSNELTAMGGQLTAPSLLDMRMDSRRFPRLHTIPAAAALEQMKAIIQGAFAYRGQNSDDANVDFIATNLLRELLADEDAAGTRSLCFAEITKIVKRAVLADELYGVSVASLYKVIHDYAKGEGLALQKEADEIVKQERWKQLRGSVIAPMLQAYSGALVKHSKI